MDISINQPGILVWARNLFTKPSKPKLPPVSQVITPPKVTEEVEEEEARRLRRKAGGGLRGTLITGELGGRRDSLLG